MNDFVYVFPTVSLVFTWVNILATLRRNTVAHVTFKADYPCTSLSWRMRLSQSMLCTLETIDLSRTLYVYLPPRVRGFQEGSWAPDPVHLCLSWPGNGLCVHCPSGAAIKMCLYQY